MRILIVEDQQLIGKAIQKGFLEESFAVDLVTNLADGVHYATEFEYDTLILDLMLPDGSGLDLLKEIRHKGIKTPVLVLTAKDTLSDKLNGFNLGCDDYLAKPFNFDELLARVNALTRRKYQIYDKVIQVGPIKMDTVAKTVECNSKVLVLTAKEFSVLELFLFKKNQVLSRDKITEHIYDEEAELGSNVIDVFINKLRRKIEATGAKNIIETIRGEGYIIRTS